MIRTAAVVLALLTPAVTARGQSFDTKTAAPPDPAVVSRIKERAAELAHVAAGFDRPWEADVAVYAKAAEWVTTLGEYYDPKAGEKALAVLDAGFNRAAELKALAPAAKPSWSTVRGKPTIRGYRSRIDGSVQPYAVTLPAGDGPPRRVDLVLHGRDATLTEVKFIHARETAKPAVGHGDAVVVELYGRGNNAYRWAGEGDIFEAWGNLVTRFGGPAGLSSLPVVLRGFSMGGAGTWHYGLHHPFRFKVLGPGAGFTVTRGYIKNLPENLPEYVERCLHIYDAADYAENAFNVPVVAYSGANDPQKAAADNVFARLKDFDEPVDAVHLVAPGLEHKMPAEWQAKAETEYAKRVKEPKVPDRVRFVTYTTRYNSALFATVEALDRHYDKAVIDARLTATGYEVKTTNVRALSLMPFTKPTGLSVAIDGQKIAAPAKSSGSMFLLKSAAGWAFADVGEWRAKPEKRSGLQGPIDDAFLEPFVVVAAGAEGYPKTAATAFGSAWWRYFRGELPTATPEGLSDRDIRGKNLVLFGTPDTNPLIARVLPKLPITWTKDELVVNGVRYDARTHVPALIYPNPLNPKCYVVLNSGHTFREADLKGTNALLYPRLGDWAVLKPTAGGAEVVAAGLFDEFWRFPKK